MSWFDLASLVILSWSAARGYYLGPGRAFYRVIGLITAMFGAFYLQQFLVVYLDREWRAIEVIAGFLKGRPGAVPVFQPYNTPPAGLAEKIVPHLPGRLDTAAAGGVPSPVSMAAVVLVMVSFILFFLLLATLPGHIWEPDKKANHLTLFSFLCGVCAGFFSLIILCLALDLFLLVFPVPFLSKDFYAAYSCRAVNVMVEWCLALIGPV